MMASACIGYRLANVAITKNSGATLTQERIARIRFVTGCVECQGLPIALDELQRTTDVPVGHSLGPAWCMLAAQDLNRQASPQQDRPNNRARVMPERRRFITVQFRGGLARSLTNSARRRCMRCAR
jgi:hypothetical protein